MGRGALCLSTPKHNGKSGTAEGITHEHENHYTTESVLQITSQHYRENSKFFVT